MITVRARAARRGAALAVVLLSLSAPLAWAESPPPNLTQLVSANFREVDFSAAMNFLAETAGANIVLSPKAQELGKPVTLRLIDIPLEKALEHLVRGQGLVYRFDEGAIFVATLDEMEEEPLETRVYRLIQGPGMFTDFEPISETRESVALQSNNVKKISTVKDILEEVIPQVGGSSIILEDRNGSLIVTHVPYYLQQVEDLLHKLDVLPTEVRIEARFIELTLTDTDEWSFDAQLTGDYALTKTKGLGETKGPGLQLASTGTQLRKGSKIDFANFSNQASGNGLNLNFQGILTGLQYSAALHALAQSNRSKTLSAPSVTTLNNQTAAIKVVNEFVYASKYEASVTREDLNGDGDFQDVVNNIRETRFVNVPQDFVTKDLGILLNVTPSVGRDLKTITLALKPVVSEQSGTDTFAGEISLPRFTTRNLSTTVVIEDGETVVLGGLMKDTTTKVLTKVPFLGSIPLLGQLFQKRSNSVRRSNLLIFVSASIVTASRDAQLAQQSSP